LIAMAKEPPTDVAFSTGKTVARLWRSASPFVPPRYFYRSGNGKRTLKAKDQPEYQLIECLKAAGVTTAGEIRRLSQSCRNSHDGQAQWEIVRTPESEGSVANATTIVPVHRPGGTREKERRVGLFFEIEFAEPVSLPIPALGHSCHFGLGLFRPIMESETAQLTKARSDMSVSNQANL
jgi:CRISPR-associated protein Csb2